MKKLTPIRPGEILLAEFLKPMGLSQYRLAKEIGVSPQRIGEIVAGRRSVTADTDLRLCRFFALSEGDWLRGQARYGIEATKDALAGELNKIYPLVCRSRRSLSACKGGFRGQSFFAFFDLNSHA